MAVSKCCFDKFNEKNDLLSSCTQSNKANQVIMATHHLIDGWYENNDVFDNTSAFLSGWTKDISHQANWLYQHLDLHVRDILDKVYTCKKSGDYEDVLYELAEYVLNPDKLGPLSLEAPDGDIYSCEGKYEFEMF